MTETEIAGIFTWAGGYDDIGIKRLLGVVNGGCIIVNGLTEEAPQV